MPYIVPDIAPDIFAPSNAVPSIFAFVNFFQRCILDVKSHLNLGFTGGESSLLLEASLDVLEVSDGKFLVLDDAASAGLVGEVCEVVFPEDIMLLLCDFLERVSG